MQIKRLLCIVFSFVVVFSFFGLNAEAANAEAFEEYPAVEHASGKFSMDVPGNTLAVTSSKFPLEVGESVTINAIYSPRSASVDFGLIAPDGFFYSFRAKDGSFDETIDVDQRGYYALAVKNNSNIDISVSGFVTY